MNASGTVPPLQHVASGSGDTLILMPGGLTGWISWIPHAEALASSRHVIRLQPHFIALGLTDDPLPPHHSIDYEVAALGNALDELGIEQADFAAWSFGAAITLSYALHNPDRIRTLTLIEPPAFWVLRSQGPLPDDVLEEQQFFESLGKSDITEEQLKRFTHFAGLVPHGVDPTTLPGWPSWLKHRQSLRFGDAPYHHTDDIARVSRFDKPVLLVKGEGSSPYYAEILDILASHFTDARVVSFPGAHAPHIVTMQPFMDTFTRFLAEAGSA